LTTGGAAASTDIAPRLARDHGVVIVAGSIAGPRFASLALASEFCSAALWRLRTIFWQRKSTRAIFESAARGETPVFLAVRYILRYVVVGLVLSVIYLTEALPIVAVVLGLAAFAFAVVIEGLIGIFVSFNRQGS